MTVFLETWFSAYYHYTLLAMRVLDLSQAEHEVQLKIFRKLFWPNQSKENFIIETKVELSSLCPACHCKARAGRSQLEYWNEAITGFGKLRRWFDDPAIPSFHYSMCKAETQTSKKTFSFFAETG